MFSHKNRKDNVGQFFSKHFLHSLDKISFEIMTLLQNIYFFLVRVLLSHIHTLTLLFNLTQMKMINLFPPPENNNLFQEACGIVGTTAVNTFVGNHWATG